MFTPATEVLCPFSPKILFCYQATHQTIRKDNFFKSQQNPETGIQVSSQNYPPKQCCCKKKKKKWIGRQISIAHQRRALKRIQKVRTGTMVVQCSKSKDNESSAGLAWEYIRLSPISAEEIKILAAGANSKTVPTNERQGERQRRERRTKGSKDKLF